MAKINPTVCLLCSVIVLTTVINLSSGSAIIIWEYLSRGEKMSHLYSMFAKQVASYCKNLPEDSPSVTQCKRNLLMYGLNKLQDMSEIHLDTMDPYQRGANDIIWDSMMDGHPSGTPKKDSTTKLPILLPANGQYMRNPLFDGPSDDVDDVTNVNTNNKNTNHENNDNFVGHNSDIGGEKDSYDPMDMDYSYGPNNGLNNGLNGVYAEPQNHLPQEASTNIHLQYLYPSLRPSYAGYQPLSYEQNTNYLSGPMVFRVRPDGTPVEEDRTKPLPTDDDRVEMTIGKEKLPTVEQIFDSFKNYRTTLRTNTNAH